MSFLAPAAAALGVLGDPVLGEPPDRGHPVAWFGSTMAAIERRLYGPTRRRGVVHAMAGVGLGLGAGAALNAAMTAVVGRRWGRFIATAAATEIAVAGAMLCDVGAQIACALEAGDVDQARQLLPSLVGRRPDDLSETEVARAVIESLAENTVDAIVAPALWAAAFGAPGALGYRAVNTLDAMVGHHNDRYEHYGWASAHVDDVANWLAARVTVALMATVRPTRARPMMATAWRDGPRHPSPNGGWVESATAAALDISLGGTNRYGDQIEHRAVMGSGRPPLGADINAAIRLVRHTTTALATVLTLVSAIDLVTGRGGAGRVKVRANPSLATPLRRLLTGRPSDRWPAK
jgi:adenosylcobinamide-phosphate synthase